MSGQVLEASLEIACMPGVPLGPMTLTEHWAAWPQRYILGRGLAKPPPCAESPCLSQSLIQDKNGASIEQRKGRWPAPFPDLLSQSSRR